MLPQIGGHCHRSTRQVSMQLIRPNLGTTHLRAHTIQHMLLVAPGAEPTGLAERTLFGRDAHPVGLRKDPCSGTHALSCRARPTESKFPVQSSFVRQQSWSVPQLAKGMLSGALGHCLSCSSTFSSHHVACTFVSRP